MTMSRRELFGWLRRPPVDDATVIEAPPPAVIEAPLPAPAAAFSLDAFYATREADRTLPAFAIRATATAPTSPVGVGPVGAASAPAAPPDMTRLAPELVPAVIEHRCLATRSFCSVCVERCPVPGAILVELGRPRVDPAKCDGCGRCVLTCPAPVLAFELVPRPQGTSP